MAATNPDLLTQIMGFLSTIAGYIGLGIVKLVQKILPQAGDLSVLKEPIGYLSILTIFVILTTAARKIAFIILIVGWALILIRLVLMVFHI